MFRSQFREQFQGNIHKDSIYHQVSNGILPPGIEYYLPLFFDNNFDDSFDDSFGDMTFRKRFNELAERPILTADDGTEFIELGFTIHDLAGNTLDVVVVVVLDPNAPLVPGTGQRDLPPRAVPTTLAELIEHYYLTGQDPSELIGG